METVWRRFTDGGYLRKSFLWVLRSVDVLFGLGGLALNIILWIQLFGNPNPVGLQVGGAINLALYLGALYAIVATVWFRAADIVGLPEGTLPAFDIASIASRLVGEVAAIVLGYGAIAGAIMVWSAGGELAGVSNMIFGPLAGLGEFGFGTFFLNSAPGIFLTGLGILVFNSLRTIFVLLGFYALAEFFVILAGLLRNTRAIRGLTAERAPVEAREETREEAPSMVTDGTGSQPESS
jgi:hypothetical protein